MRKLLLAAALLCAALVSTPAAAQVVAPVVVVVPNSIRASYSTSQTVNLPAAAASLAAVESSAALFTRLRYFKVCLSPSALQTTAGVRTLFLFRTTAASTGGSLQVPLVRDPTDIPFAGLLRTGAITTTPAAPTIIANSIWSAAISVPAAASAAVVCTEAKDFDKGGDKAPLAIAGVANGLALFDATGGAGAAGSYVVDAAWTAESN